MITGGGTGIGRAVASRLVAAGDQVVLLGRRPEKLADAVAELGPASRAMPVDATDPAALQAALGELPERVDVLINAAGGNTDLVDGAPAADDLKAVRDSWSANFEANVLSAVLVTHALLPRLADDARIVNLGSVTARSGQGSYGAVKAALEPWTSELAFQLGSRGITANVISPGRPPSGADPESGRCHRRGSRHCRQSIVDPANQLAVNIICRDSQVAMNFEIVTGRD
ncbi:SDR family oxidoreductase [Saccharopolyspora shandongensis]|uniref:SDR family oxidoreductase n=1 Tax=Saccharopolyspora shandongensis TaxID=418495 RepID=UPI0034247B44